MLCSHHIPLAVLTYIVELSRWHSQSQHQHTIHRAQHLFLTAFNRCSLLSFSSHFSQFQSEFLQLQANQRRHVRGVFTAVCFRHSFFRHETVFRHDVGYSRKGTSVAQWMLEQPFHCLVVHRFTSRFNNSLQEQIGFFQLVPEERIYLRELQSWQVIACNGLGTHHVQSRKQPATARRLLVGDAF